MFSWVRFIIIRNLIKLLYILREIDNLGFSRVYNTVKREEERARTFGKRVRALGRRSHRNLLVAFAGIKR